MKVIYIDQVIISEFPEEHTSGRNEHPCIEDQDYKHDPCNMLPKLSYHPSVYKE